VTTRKLADRAAYPAKHSEPAVITLFIKVLFGSGAVTSYTSSPGCTFVRDNAGEYSLTFPPCATVLGVHATYVGAAAADRVPQVETFDAGTGDADLNLCAGATPTDGVDGDQLFVTLHLQGTATR
jgi:hypothetical protein